MDTLPWIRGPQNKNKGVSLKNVLKHSCFYVAAEESTFRGVERHDTREEEVKRGLMPRFSVWITRLVDGPELTTKMRKWKSLFSPLAFAKCLLALVTFQIRGLGRSIKHNPFLQDA